MAPPDPFHPTSSFYMIVRHLLSRMVCSLGIKPSRSMEILAFWLWIEGNGHLDFLTRIGSFSDKYLFEIASAGNTFIEALYLKPSELSNSRSTQGCYFQKEAMAGILFYLNNFCYKVFQDLQETEEMETIYSTSHGHHENRKDKHVPMSRPMSTVRKLDIWICVNSLVF
jgi:hypothetical protein